MTWPGMEPWSSRPLANILPTKPMCKNQQKQSYNFISYLKKNLLNKFGILYKLTCSTAAL